MGLFGSLFKKKEKSSSDFDMGGMGKDFPQGFGADMGGSQGFPDAWSGSGAGDPGFSTQQPSQFSSPSYGQQQFPQQSPSFSSNSSASFSQASSPSFSPSYGQSSYGSPQQSYGNDADYMHSKNLEVISSKIDALRAAIDSMNARLQNIERIAGQEEENRRKRYY